MLSNFRSQWVSVALASIFMLIGFSGCAQQKAQQKETVFDQWRARAAESKGFSPPEQHRIIDMPQAMTPSVPAGSVGTETVKPLPDKPVTLKIHQADIAVLLRALARSVGISIIVNDTVKGGTSLNVDKIPWNQVFEGILKTHGLSYAWEGNLLRIVTLEDKATIVRGLEADQKILSKRREMELSEPMLTKIIHVDYADAAKLKTNLEKFLSQVGDGKPLGSVLLDEHNNALIIQATRNDLERMIALITELDQPTAQVLIEAHIIEATSETARELGVQWGGLYTGNDYWVTPNAGDAIGLTAGEAVDPSSGWASNFPADVSGASVEGAGFALGMIVQSGDLLLSAQLNALEEEGKLNILSKPSITTLDNQTAIIESGDEVPFQTVDDNKVQIEYKKAVLRLEVTPHVIEGDTLKMDIITNKDELDFTRTVSGNPTVITKKAETNVVLFDGQTTVIGGLNKQTDRDLDYGLPWLRHVPGLGYLFKGESSNRQMQELLIFITPHILKRRPPVTAGTPAPVQ
ncbi:type II/III secretion system protein [Desulfosarcina alkanivorans]|uniref:Type II/III secretion system protein n=1 Tax=Desulfosarcina alkanivorans TaxID=571177 RepID=A0A5K7YL22_9BACT|nr:type IV pilus secretin PilQ [Desulfosarcina alkanivorans]BBO66994.1 type II/III secretion system protein [Desulfosarcina alkanivorans]